MDDATGRNRFEKRSVVGSVKPVTPDIYGATQVLSHLAKPGNPAAPAKVILNWYCLLTDQPIAFGRRSKPQVLDAAERLLRQLELAWEVSGWVTGYMIQSVSIPVEKPRLAGNIVDFIKAKAAENASIEAAVETHWKPYAPVMHLLTAWRREMFRSRRGLIFNATYQPRAERLQRLADLLTDKPDWATNTATASVEHLAFLALNVKQLPRTMRIFAAAE